MNLMEERHEADIEGLLSMFPPKPEQTYRYLLLRRPRSIGTQPEDYTDWIDYDERRLIPEYGVSAWGELFYNRELTTQEVADYELFECHTEERLHG